MAGLSEHELRTADGVPLQATVHRGASAPTAAVVLSHGFAASRDEPEIAALTSQLADGSTAVVVYDSRGHGASGGQCTLGDSERLDVAAAVDHAAGFGVPVVVAGFSMGGIASIRYMAAATDDPPSPGRSAVVGLVTISTPSHWSFKLSAVGTYVRLLTTTRIGRAIATRHPGVRIAPQLSDPPEPVSVIGEIVAPTAFVHGAADRMFPAADAAALHDSATDPRMLDLVAGMAHGLTDAGREATRRACRWTLDQAG